MGDDRNPALIASLALALASSPACSVFRQPMILHASNVSKQAPLRVSSSDQSEVSLAAINSASPASQHRLPPSEASPPHTSPSLLSALRESVGNNAWGPWKIDLVRDTGHGRVTYIGSFEVNLLSSGLFPDENKGLARRHGISPCFNSTVLSSTLNRVKTKTAYTLRKPPILRHIPETIIITELVAQILLINEFTY